MFQCLLSIFSFCLIGLPAPAQTADPVVTNPAPEMVYQVGDVIGESEVSVDPSTSFFEAATQSRYGHVGVLLRENSQWVIYEELPPQAEVVPLKDFLARSQGHITVLRKKTPLTAEQLSAVTVEAHRLVAAKWPYNDSQISNAKGLNCSEFVHAVFAAAHLQVGKTQTVADMHLKAFKGTLWKEWRNENPDVSLQSPVLTPKSVMVTADWKWVGGPINPQVVLTDLDLVHQWKAEKVLDGIADEWGVPAWIIEKLAEP